MEKQGTLNILEKKHVFFVRIWIFLILGREIEENNRKNNGEKGQRTNN